MKKDAKNLRIVFMGTPLFASSILMELLEREYNIVGTITVPDKPAGRGMKLRSSAVKDYVVSYNAEHNTQIPLLQPEKLRDESFISELKSLEADLFIVVAFRMLPEVVWSMPTYGTFNLHASLLPEYRGAAPINWAIINGETHSGVTTFFLNDKIDCGNIIMQRQCAINEGDTAGDLHDNLLALARDLVPETVDNIVDKSYTLLSQNSLDESELKPAPKIFKEDMELCFNVPARQAYNKVRGLAPFPSAWCKTGIITMIDGAERNALKAKVFSVRIGEPANDIESGTWQSDGKTYLRVMTEDCWIYIEDLQVENKKRMTIVDFLRGWR